MPRGRTAAVARAAAAQPRRPERDFQSMSLEFLSREATDRLAEDVTKNLEAYRLGNTAALIVASDCRVSKIEIAMPPVLDDLAEDKQDALATQRIFQWLSHLTPVQAADERLWVLLTHRYFSRYVHRRWGGGLDEKSTDE